MADIKTNPMKNSTILRLNLEKEIIDTNPEYQRNSDVWTKDKRQLLIDSILNDYDIPKLYFYVLPKRGAVSGKQRYEYAIIDGRQRIETIWSFMNGGFALSDDFGYLKDKSIKAGGMTYFDLSKKYPKLKIVFDSFILPIICVETDDMDLVEDMFSRLNEAVPLNAAEKRNAIGGPMVRLIKEVSKHPFFTQKVRFSDKRYQHREVAVKLIYLEESLKVVKKIQDTLKPYLDGYVKNYKRLNSDPVRIGEKVERVLGVMNHYFINGDELLSAQSGIPIYYLVFRKAIRKSKIDKISRDILVEFREKIADNRKIAEKDITKANYDLLEFERLSQQGANYAASIKERLRIISEYLKI